ncbi:GntR family transcriptional regulator [Aquibium sp. A9E412]|uniref:GntR family transcriptional regulator n=1 Tax=Aquibium sp. A9E412 TaxID=2976767 RepID=UPI0025B0C147|nr:GntR family transcriptional regulator [Aquibium sp. A9E412]MDN2565596.1 GntR family transcriptional regulator [Aquibium sp. A9E412]
MRDKGSVSSLGVERRSLADRAADAIRERIVTGVCAPGSRITEQQFAEELGLSRGTIRTALRELSHEGLTEVRPYSGWSVVTLTAEDAAELAALRGALEGLAARLAAEAMTEEAAAVLDGAYDALKRAAADGDHKVLVASDLALHKTIFQLAGNSRLTAHYLSIEPALRMYVALADRGDNAPQDIADWHDGLVAAIRAGDGERAEAIAKANARATGAELQAILSASAARQAGGEAGC